MTDLPFANYQDKQMGECLVEEFIMKSVRWFLGGNLDGTTLPTVSQPIGAPDRLFQFAVLSQLADSAWETASTILFFTTMQEAIIEKRLHQLDMADRLAQAKRTPEQLRGVIPPLELEKLRKIHPDLFVKVDERLPEITDWLLSKARRPYDLPGQEHFVDFDGKELLFVCWDKVTWDTAVVIRGLLRAIPSLDAKKDAQRIAQIKTAAIWGCVWLLLVFYQQSDQRERLRASSEKQLVPYRFTAAELAARGRDGTLFALPDRSFDSALKYPFGPADIAQILTTVLYMDHYFTVEFKEVVTRLNELIPGGLFPEKKDGMHILQDIAEYLLHAHVSLPQRDDIDHTYSESAYWADAYNTAEVSEAIGRYYRMILNQANWAKSQQNTEGNQPDIDEIRKVLRLSFQWIEQEQSEDGTWGAGSDTMRVAQAYVRLPTLLVDESPKAASENRRKLRFRRSPRTHSNGRSPTVLVEASPYRVFKTLRWLCDSKQRFADGSFQHSTFLTIYYAHALVTIYKYWDLIEERVDTIYDDVVWNAPMRLAPERAERLALRLEKLRLDYHLQRQKQRIKQQTNTIRLLGSAIAAFVVLFMIFITSFFVRIFIPNENASTPFIVSDYIAIGTTVIFIFVSILLAILTRPPTTDV